jgi:hypothetical protein
MFKTLRLDIKTVFNRDPAARSVIEIHPSDSLANNKSPWRFQTCENT